MTTTTFSAELASELAQREAFHASTRAQRCANALCIIRTAKPLTVLRTVDVLYPVSTNNGCRYRKVSELRELAF
jgi:hypothetical protein